MTSEQNTPTCELKAPAHQLEFEQTLASVLLARFLDLCPPCLLGGSDSRARLG